MVRGPPDLERLVALDDACAVERPPGQRAFGVTTGDERVEADVVPGRERVGQRRLRRAVRGQGGGRGGLRRGNRGEQPERGERCGNRCSLQFSVLRERSSSAPPV